MGIAVRRTRGRTGSARRAAGCRAKKQSLKSEGRMPPGTAAPARVPQSRPPAQRFAPPTPALRSTRLRSSTPPLARSFLGTQLVANLAYLATRPPSVGGYVSRTIPLPRSMLPMTRALSFFATSAASFSATMTVMPMPILKT